MEKTRSRGYGDAMITVPAALVGGTIAREGEDGRQWIRALPELAGRALDRWRCTIDGEPTHGAVALVLPVRSPRGPAVLKISFPHPGNVDEPRALDVWAGEGAVRLYAHDGADFAMLLERVEQRTLDLEADEGITVGGELARRLAVPGPAAMPPVAASADGWAQQLREQDRATGHPLSDRVIGAALETIDAVGHDRTPTMIHGDLHAGNILASDRGWVAVDPKGQTGPVEYDAMTMCLHRHEEMITAADPVAELLRRVDLFCDAAGADHAWARRLVHARLTSSALYDMLQQGSPLEQDWGRLALEAAQVLVDAI